jgi:glycosyltransferase involved in cell wall biosynthesis
MTRSVSIVIPAFNEEAAIQQVLSELQQVMHEHEINAEIIVVDDGSMDLTAELAAAAGARVLRHRSNRGYGASLKTGIAAATHEAIVITDADGTYPPKYIVELLDELDHADMVVGARTGANVKIPLVRRPAKWVLNRLANYLVGTRIRDLNSGLRAFRQERVRHVGSASCREGV